MVHLFPHHLVNVWPLANHLSRVSTLFLKGPESISTCLRFQASCGLCLNSVLLLHQ